MSGQYPRPIFVPPLVSRIDPTLAQAAVVLLLSALMAIGAPRLFAQAVLVPSLER